MFSNVGMPHGYCFFWQPGLLWLHVVSDSLIAFAYLLIPFALLRIIRRRSDIPFNGVVLAFGAFILACGSTHLMDVYTLWHPVYWLSGTLKAFTAVISIATFFILIRLTPAILKFPSSADMRQLNDRLNSVLESTSDGVLTIDFNWQVLYANRVAQETNPGKELLGRSLWESFPPLHGSTAEEQLTIAMVRRFSTTYEEHYPPYDQWFRVHAFPSTDGITLFFSNITAEKKLQLQLQQEKELKEQRIEALGHMAGGLAHEINNPLSIIQARASDLKEIADEGVPVPSMAVQSACESILRTCGRAVRILRGLQGFAREGSKDPMQTASVQAIADQTVELVVRRFQTHKVDLQVTVQPALPGLECREVQISQIILNLLNNAFDAVDSSGKQERWVRLQIAQAASGDSPGLCIEVIDSGLGVDEKSKSHLMEPFFTTKPVGSGLGVGLSLSRAIARDHHGTLELTSVDGHTCFRLLLPFTQPQVSTAAATSPPRKFPHMAQEPS